MLIREPDKHVLYAIDKYWFQLQERDNWYLIVPLTVTQLDGYSDIEKRITNYTRVMIDLDKKWLLPKETRENKVIIDNPIKMGRPSVKLYMNTGI
jgi:hypothetical protein